MGNGSIWAWADQEWNTCERSSARIRASSAPAPVANEGLADGDVWVKAVDLSREGEAEVDAGGGRVGPARGDDLAAGVEVHALGAVHVGVAEQRSLPAAEGVVGHRHRDRHVDADHTHLDVVLERSSRSAIAGEDRRAVGLSLIHI